MSVADRVELAHEPDLVLGRLTVSPSRRELVRDDGEREVIEHRVMQVLVALSRAKGDIVTRDELTMSCWDGRVVGEDSIHRVMSRLRKIASGIGAGSIEIETITKIGYRLTSNGGETKGHVRAVAGERMKLVEDLPAARPTRRGLMLAGVAAGTLAAAGGGALLYRRMARPSVRPEVQALVTQARQLKDMNTREAQYQAIGLLKRAVELAPNYADGWGLLGCAYAIPSHYREQAEAIGLRARAEAAGRRSLELDPGNGYGELALSLALPFIGHWLERDRRLARALADWPDDEELLAFRAVTLIFVGRSRDALSFYARIRRPFTPAVYTNYISALWNSGMVEETDRAMKDAAALYPTQVTIWMTRFNINMFSGNPAASIAMVQDAYGLPTGYDEESLVRLIAAARAIAGGDQSEVETVAGAQIQRAHESAFGAEHAMRVCCALGRLDDAYAIADAYYFARGFTVPDYPGSSFSPNQRQTRLLFEPVTRPMRADARFNRLVEEIGLDRYWIESGVQPDFRRA